MHVYRRFMVTFVSKYFSGFIHRIVIFKYAFCLFYFLRHAVPNFIQKSLQASELHTVRIWRFSWSLQVRRCGYVELSHLISHVRQILKAHGRTEDLVVHVHDLVLVTARVQVVYGALDQVQTFMAWSLQVVLGREIGPKHACQASMISEVTALENKKGCFKDLAKH